MDTNNIKKFATEARNKLKAGIAAKILTLGFDRNGNVSENAMPQLMQGGTLWNGNILPEGFYHQWMSLYKRIQQHGVNSVFEEAAYTWFNRLVAIRILQKNGIISPVMAYADSARTPMIVQEARQGRLPIIENELLRSNLMQLLDDDTKTAEQFALLIVAYCHQNPIIRACFGSMADYTELLLPQNILSEGGFVDMLNHTEFITDDDFHSPELIGWLYQFYNAERKDEAFAKKGKYEADDIAPATQIFTPNWIVKYMVENTVGRIYLDNNPYATDMKERWKYLVEPEEPTPADAILHYDELTDLRVADLSCGSGHILNECFDMLYDLYIAEGYGRREAIEDIFHYNLTGIDLDTRAKQLATFALLLKACQKDASFADAHCLPKVLDMPEPYVSDVELRDTLPHYFLGGSQSLINQSIEAIQLMNDAKTLGSIMQFDLTEENRQSLKDATDRWHQESCVPKAITQLLPYFDVILALTEKYHAVVMNPPYMACSKIDLLKKYAESYYPLSRVDLMTVFMEVAYHRLVTAGKYGMINLPSWISLSSYENFRNNLITYSTIESFLHLGRGVFGSDFGSVSFVISKGAFEIKGYYRRLFKEHVQVRSVEVIERLFLDNGYGLYYSDQSKFRQITGTPIAYWVSEKIRETFTNNLPLSAVCKPTQGLATADNGRFVRSWFEVDRSRIYFGCPDAASAARSQKKWFPYNKGGQFRKWYGNQDLIVNWENDGYEIKHFVDDRGKLRSRPQNLDYFFRQSISWSKISAGNIAFRYYPVGFIFDVAGTSLFPKEVSSIAYDLALVNSSTIRGILKIISPTVNYEVGQIATLPFAQKSDEEITRLSEECISLSKADWDAHETSRDFAKNELMAVDSQTYKDNINYAIEKHLKETGEEIDIDPAAPRLDSLEWRMEQYKQKWERLFMQLHANEEELNRQFIDIYGLQDELTPDVPLDEVTILQQGEIAIADNNLKFNDDVIIKQFISYAVGCMMGRYRLDRPGLAIAHPDATEDEYAPYQYNGETFDIDDDAIVPLMPVDSGFSDNAAQRLNEFVRIAFGDENHVANLNFIEKCLGKTVEQYFVKDFWKDHKKMYQNRPIYWLFASKKGSFQVITYMHRMNAYTVERIRAKYLLPYIEHLQNNIAILEGKGAALSTAESRKLDSLKKVLDECREYHERLQVVAEQAIAFDLDDGVVVNHAKFGDVVTKLK